jgi:hypothetical protein
MRPFAAFLVAVISPTPITPNQLTLLNLFLFVIATGLLIALPTWSGSLIAVGVLEFSYAFDCADGMLARYKKLASKQGHLFDFFTDEIKAMMLTAGVGLHLWRRGGFGLDGSVWQAGDVRFLLATIAGVTIVSSGLSLTNFVRRPELSGKETSVEAYYETVEQVKPASLVRRLAGQAMVFLRFLNHYPSHIWLFAAVQRLDIFYWMYLSLNLLYLARGWLGLVLRFGRS